MTIQAVSVSRQQLLDRALVEVEKAARHGELVAVEPIAQKLLDAFVDGPMTVSEFETEIIRLAIARRVGCAFSAKA